MARWCECCTTRVPKTRITCDPVTKQPLQADLCDVCAEKHHSYYRCGIHGCGRGVWHCAMQNHFALSHPSVLEKLSNDPVVAQKQAPPSPRFTLIPYRSNPAKAAEMIGLDPTEIGKPRKSLFAVHTGGKKGSRE